jgi:GR25 family glycosyltransferase involved in LPS biosynthesis
MSTYWNKGALGYCISYASAIADALQSNSKQVLILDDDAVLMPNMFEVLEKAYKTLPDDWHMLYLAANHGVNAKPTEADRISDTVYRMKGSLGSHAIIINRRAFETILNFATSPYGPLGVFLSVYQQICPCYITYPGLATQLSGYSDIINKDVDYTKAIDYINHI